MQPLAKAYCTRKVVKGVVYLRLSMGRYKGATVLGRYQGASQADAELAMAEDKEGLEERYKAALGGVASLETIAGLLNAYERSTDFETSKSASTKAVWSNVIKSIKESSLGPTRASALKLPGAPGALTKWRDAEAEKRGPRAADYRMDILNAAFNWHVAKGNIPKNPAAGIEDVYVNDRSDLIWEASHIKAFRAYIKVEIDRVWREWKPGPARYEQIWKLVNASDVLTAALNSGMRRGDLAAFLNLSVRDGAVIYTPNKSKNRARTSKRRKKARTVVLPILRDMERMLARRREAGMGTHVFAPYGGESYTASALGHLVTDIAGKLELGRTLHDAKGSFVTKLKIEAKLDDAEIASLVDWSVANVQSIIHQYVSGAARTNALVQRFRRA